MRRQRTGFTLVEAMVVVALVALTILAVPPMVQWLCHQGVDHAICQLQADLQLARLMAIDRQQTCRIAFNQPAGNQYVNLLDGRRSDLAAYRGGVHFIKNGPDGMPMAEQVDFNRQGMSTSVAPMDVFIADRNNATIYRLRILLPGGVSRYRWQGGRWK